MEEEGHLAETTGDIIAPGNNNGLCGRRRTERWRDNSVSCYNFLNLSPLSFPVCVCVCVCSSYMTSPLEIPEIASYHTSKTKVSHLAHNQVELFIFLFFLKATTITSQSRVEQSRVNTESVLNEVFAESDLTSDGMCVCMCICLYPFIIIYIKLSHTFLSSPLCRGL